MTIVDEETANLVAKALLEVEWLEHGGPVFTCVGCHHAWTFQKVHTPTCRVDVALTRLGYPDRESRDRAIRQLRDDDFNRRWAPVLAAVPAVPKVWNSPTPCIQLIPESPTSDPEFDADPDDGGD